MGNLARFTVDLVGSDPPGYDAAPSAVLSLKLEAPSGVVQRWTMQVDGPINSDAPESSLHAPALTLVGATSGEMVDALTVLSAILVTMPSTRAHSWKMRSKVNGGIDAFGNANPDYVFERVISIRTSSGLRKIVENEGTTYLQRGVADAQNEEVDAFGGGGDRAIAGIAHVDPTFSGSSLGSAIAPYATIAAAIAGLGGSGTIFLAPATYAEASIAVPSGSRIKIVGEGASSITNQVVWTAANADELHISGVQLPGGIGLKDANSGTAAVLLTLESLSCAAIVNANSGSTAHTHIFNLTLIGKVFGQTRLSDSSDLVLSAACSVNGAIYASNSAFLANLTCSGLFGDHVYLGPSVTLTSAGNSVLLNSEYDTGVTVALGGSGSTLFVDLATSYFARTLTGTLATQVIYQNLKASLLHDDSGIGAANVAAALDFLNGKVTGLAPLKYSFLNLTGNFSATNIAILPAGFYNVVIELYLHTTGTSGGITAALQWTDRASFGHGVATIQDRGSIALVVANAYSLPISVDGVHNVTHSVTGVGTAGSLQYDLHYTFTPQS